VFHYRLDSRLWHLEIDLNDFVKVILFHVEKELILSDPGCIHTHRGRLEVAAL